ncbi:MAG: TrkH family potassium uptake protein [Holophagales bacterium]|nr:TrkH family potassium uptake protein [Holophagales bacterium]
MQWRPPLRFLGRLLVLLGVAELLPTVVCLSYGEMAAALAFVLTAVLTAGCGLILAFLGREGGELYRKEGILIVVGGWVLASVFGALPYMLTGTLPAPADAIFESASGFTTTGASVITDIEGCGRGILFWRSFSQWLGGMGIIVLFVALLPELGAGARFLYKLEVPGPTAETLHPRVHDTAAVLWRIYLGMTGVQVLLLMVGGLDLYDALTHTFSTLSTGGFSPRNASVGAFDSVFVQIVILVFMMLAGANFSLYYGLRKRRGWRNLALDPELRIYLALCFGVAALIAWNLMSESPGYHDGHPAQAFLDSLFQVVSMLTTTGFGSADFDTWPNLSRLLLVGLMFVGGCAGSTSGGVKIMRFYIGLKTAAREVRLMWSPSQVISIFVGGKAVPNQVVRSVVGFFLLYFACWAGGVLVLTVGGLDLESSATASIATLGNIGPGLGEVGPSQSFAFFAPWQKLFMVLLMWLGRLEVYAIMAVMTVAFWRR